MSRILPMILLSLMLFFNIPGYPVYANPDPAPAVSRELQAPRGGYSMYPLPMENRVGFKPSHRSSFNRQPTNRSNVNLYGKTPGLYSAPKPPENSGIDAESRFAHVLAEYAGPSMELIFAWRTVDFEFDSIRERDAAIYHGNFIPENNALLGLDVWKNKVFVTIPQWQEGVPATLSWAPKDSTKLSPKLIPYPNWSWHKKGLYDLGSCDSIISVFRVQVDECDRLWVMDSGNVNIMTNPVQMCPPKLLIFDLRTDRLIRKYVFPKDHIKEDGMYVNVIVDLRNKDCAGAKAYMANVWRFGLAVYDFYKNSSYYLVHHFFYPDPLASRYELHGLKFAWSDGLFGMSLSPLDVHGERTLYFHALSSFYEFAVPTSVLANKTIALRSTDKFNPVGTPRAKDFGHASASAIDRNGVMFINMVTRDSIWCWDTRKEHIPQNMGVVASSNVSMVFPNDIKVDHEPEQNVWVLSDKLPMFFIQGLDSAKINYRIFRASVQDAITDTVCDPNYVVREYRGYGGTY